MRYFAAIVAAAFFVVAPAALADDVTVPGSAGLPWTDPAHHSPLEQLASAVATRIAGHTVSVRCEDPGAWTTLTQQIGAEAGVRGYVQTPRLDSQRRFVADAEVAELSPAVCGPMQTFAAAAVKPTKCQPLVTQTTTEYVRRTRTVYVEKQETIRVRVRVHGRWVWRTKRRTVTVPKTVTETVPETVTRQVPGPPVPCYVGGRKSVMTMPSEYWQTYRDDASALLTLAHESIHLAEARAGVSADMMMPAAETHATCYGMQWLPYVARTLGATADDARAVARYAFDYVYPTYAGVTHNGSPYWSADCRENGSLDLTPNDGAWP